MRVAFRVDASIRIGSGHVMRCLVLADRLRAAGASCHFVMREHDGHLGSTVELRGHVLNLLPRTEAAPTSSGHAAWLGAAWETDADESLSQLANGRFDWLVVDHYGLDLAWETRLRGAARHLLVIDDLANRPHRGELLLDQNLGRKAQDYAALAPDRMHRLIGPRYAMMQTGFAALRAAAVARRQALRSPQRLLISLGGVDADNLTGTLLHLLARRPPVGIKSVDVVLGKHAPHQQAVRAALQTLGIPGDLHIDTPRMPCLVADADVAIGAAGVSAWERCALGLPTLLVQLAENQRTGAQALERAGAGFWLGEGDQIATRWSLGWERLLEPETYQRMQSSAASVTDGLGADRVVAAMQEVS